MAREALAHWAVGLAAEVVRKLGEPRVEVSEEVAERLVVARVRGRRDEQEVPPGVRCKPADQVRPHVAPGAGAARLNARVGLVHDHEPGCRPQELEAVAIALDEVEADHHERVALEQRLAQAQAALQPRSRRRHDEHGVDVELVPHLGLPLLGEVRRREDGHPVDLAAVVQFAGDQHRLNGLPDADVVGDEEADGLLAERHEKWHELVRARLDGDPGEAAERPGAVAHRQPQRLVQKPRRGVVAQVRHRRRWEGRRDDVVALEREVDACDLVHASAKWSDDQDGVVRRGEHDPLAPAGANEVARREPGC